MLRLLSLLAAAACAATATSYDGAFTVEIPSGLKAAPVESFAKSRNKPYLALERKDMPLPVLLLMKVEGADAKKAAERERQSFVEHNKGNPKFHATPVQETALKGGAKTYWFSNGMKPRDYVFIYFPLQDKVVKAGCPGEVRLICDQILGTLKPAGKPLEKGDG